MATGLGPNGGLHEREVVALPRPGSRPYLRTEAPGTVCPFPSLGVPAPSLPQGPPEHQGSLSSSKPHPRPLLGLVLGDIAAVHKPGLTPMGGTVWRELPDPEAQGEW